MAYVEPNSTIQIFKNVPLDNSYRNTYWFTSINAQDDFWGVTKYVDFYGITFPENSYTRKGRGYVRLNIAPDTIISYNYMRYRNVNHGSKWYYAFILDVAYINENTAEITYQLDYIQSYMFEVTIHDSFVERQHNLTDNVGDNLVSESLPCGSDYYVENHGDIINLAPDRMLFLISTHTGIVIPGQGIGKEIPMFSIVNSYPAKIAFLTCKMPTTPAEAESTSTLVKSFLAPISDDNVVSVFAYNHVLDELIPFASESAKVGGNYIYYPGSGQGPQPVFKLGAVETPISSPSIGIVLNNKFGGYSAKNNKLLTHPYKYLIVENGLGSSQELKYELFSNNTYNFKLFSALIPKPDYILYPLNYATSIDPDLHTNPYPVGYDYGIELSVDGSVPYATDAYKGYLLANAGSRTMAVSEAIMELYGMFAGGMSGGALGSFASSSAITQNRSNGKFASGFNLNGKPVPGKTLGEAQSIQNYNNMTELSGAFSGIKNMIVQDLNARGFANGFKGTLDNTGVLVGANRYKFEYNQIRIKEENARIIDDFFTMFGYAQKKLMPVLSPSSDSVATKNARRPHFNYTKTVGCNVFVTANSATNGCASEDLANIATIYDNGITFWNPADTVGDYSLNNAPVVTP